MLTGSSCPVQMVGLSIRGAGTSGDECGRFCRSRRMPETELPGQPAGFPGSLSRSSEVVGGVGGHAPDHEPGVRQRDVLRDPRHRHPQAVVARGPDIDRDVDRHVDRGSDEGQPRGLIAEARLHVEDRGGAEFEVGVALIVRPDDHIADLRGERALLQREVFGRALRDRVGIPEHALRGGSPRRPGRSPVRRVCPA